MGPNVTLFTLDRFTRIIKVSRANFSKVRNFKSKLILCREIPVDGYAKSAEFNLVHIFNCEEKTPSKFEKTDNIGMS